jgi:hypothetical protein
VTATTASPSPTPALKQTTPAPTVVDASLAPDAMARWPSAPMSAHDRRLLPHLLPLIDAGTTVARLEQTDDHYGQMWTGTGTGTGTGTELTIDTLPGRRARGWAPAGPAIAPWDRSFTAPANNDYIKLEDPSGSVTIDAVGLSGDEVLAVAGSLTRRDGGRAGWDVGRLPSGLATSIDGWAPPGSFELLAWSSPGPTMQLVQLEIAWGELGSPFDADEQTVTTPVEIDGHTAVAYTVARGLTAVVWSPAPEVAVRLGVTGASDRAIAVARTVSPVDNATWASSTTEVEMDGCGFYSRC